MPVIEVETVIHQAHAVRTELPIRCLCFIILVVSFCSNSPEKGSEKNGGNNTKNETDHTLMKTLLKQIVGYSTTALIGCSLIVILCFRKSFSLKALSSCYPLPPSPFFDYDTLICYLFKYLNYQVENYLIKLIGNLENDVAWSYIRSFVYLPCEF